MKKTAMLLASAKFPNALAAVPARSRSDRTNRNPPYVQTEREEALLQFLGLEGRV